MAYYTTIQDFTNGNAFAFTASGYSLIVTATGGLITKSYAAGYPDIYGVTTAGFTHETIENSGYISAGIGVYLDAQYEIAVNTSSGTIIGTTAAVKLDHSYYKEADHVENYGIMIGQDDGITINNADEDSIVNYGTISGRVGIKADEATVSIENSGSITADYYAFASTGGSLSLVNSGVIHGKIGLGGSDALSNAGKIVGDVTFSGLSATFNGIGGSVDGNITGSGGSDTFDLSHQVVTGTISGGGGDDIITGTAGNDTISGGAGADTINGGAGDDLISGGADVDHLDGGAGTNTLSCADEFGVLVDLLFPNKDSNGESIANFQNVIGSPYTDQLLGDQGDNVLSGGGGADVLYGRGGNDSLNGGTGNDFVYAGTGSSQYEGGDGIDLIGFTNVPFGVTISLAAQGSSAQALGGSSIVIDGFESLGGSGFADTLTGDGKDNSISGGGGDDHINGGLGNDTILGGAGNDTLIGGGGTDTVSYADALAGVTVSLAKTAQQNTVGSGLDTISGFVNLTGSSHNDTLTGTTGANNFSGLGGKDTITGGGGHDTFNISSLLSAANIASVTDFSPTDDVFALNRAIFATIPPSPVLPTASFFQGAAAHDTDDRIIYNSASGNIYYDDDGNGPDAAVQFAHVSTGLTLTASDFHVYGVM